MNSQYNNVFSNIDFSPMFDVIKNSIRSIADNGIVLMFWIAGIIVVLSLIRHFSKSAFIKEQVKKRSAMRQVFKADYEGNLDEMIDDNVRKNELKLLSNKRMFEKNRDMLVLDREQNMEINHEAKMLFHEKNPNAYAEERDLNYKQSQEYYKSRGHH